MNNYNIPYMLSFLFVCVFDGYSMEQQLYPLVFNKDYVRNVAYVLVGNCKSSDDIKAMLKTLHNWSLSDKHTNSAIKKLLAANDKNTIAFNEFLIAHSTQVIDFKSLTKDTNLRKKQAMAYLGIPYSLKIVEEFVKKEDFTKIKQLLDMQQKQKYIEYIVPYFSFPGCSGYEEPQKIERWIYQDESFGETLEKFPLSTRKLCIQILQERLEKEDIPNKDEELKSLRKISGSLEKNS
jgi:hypothetical protein